jgi:hypothetical protein
MNLRWIVLDPPTKPWWAIHAYNLAGTSGFVAIAWWFDSVIAIAATAAFWGAANMNGFTCIWVRYELQRDAEATSAAITDGHTAKANTGETL